MAQFGLDAPLFPAQFRADPSELSDGEGMPAVPSRLRGATVRPRTPFSLMMMAPADADAVARPAAVQLTDVPSLEPSAAQGPAAQTLVLPTSQRRLAPRAPVVEVVREPAPQPLAHDVLGSNDDLALTPAPLPSRATLTDTWFGIAIDDGTLAPAAPRIAPEVELELEDDVEWPPRRTGLPVWAVAGLVGGAVLIASAGAALGFVAAGLVATM